MSEHGHHDDHGHGGHGDSKKGHGKKSTLGLEWLTQSKGCLATTNVLISIILLGLASIFYLPSEWIPKKIPESVQQFFKDSGRRVWGKNMVLKTNFSTDYQLIVVNGSLAKSPLAEILKRIPNNVKNKYQESPVFVTCKTPKVYAPLWEIALPNTDFKSVASLKEIHDDQYLYFIVESELSAIDRKTGEVAWTKSLSSKINEECTQCMEVKGDMLFVLTDDRAFYGVENKTGNIKWQINLDMNESTRSGFIYLQNQLVVIDEVKEQSQKLYGLFLFDPKSGRIQKKIIPHLSKFSKNVQVIHIDEFREFAYFVMEEGNKKVIQRCQLSDGKIMWTKNLPDGLQVKKDLSFSEQNVFFTEKSLYLAGTDKKLGYVLIEINLQNGNIESDLDDRESELSILFKKGKTILIHAHNNKNNKSEVWAVDENSGKLLWKHPVETPNIYLNGMVLKTVPEKGQWIPFLINKGLGILQVEPNTKTLHFRVLDLKDGHILFEKNNPVENTMISGYQMVNDQNLFISMFALYQLNCETGELLQDWP